MPNGSARVQNWTVWQNHFANGRGGTEGGGGGNFNPQKAGHPSKIEQSK